MPAKALPFQREGVRDMEDFLEMGGGVLLADDMGLGKTLQTLWLMRRAKVGPMLPALVVCPANVKYGWEHTALEHLGWRSQVIEGRTPPKEGFGSVALPPITIINPDILQNWLPFLLAAGFKTLVLDECQAFGNYQSKRTRAAIDLARVCSFRVALSGTPLLNAPGELWPMLYMLRPDVFNSLFSYAQEFCRPKKEFGKWTYKGSQNLDKLHATLKRTVMVRRLKEDVVKDLPSKHRVVVSVDITDRGEYNFARDDFKGWLRKNYRDKKGAVVRANRASAVARVGYLVRLAAKLKCKAVVGWANRFLEENPDEKLVLFGYHTKMLRVLERRVNAGSVVVDGQVSKRQRKYAVSTFQRDKDTRVFIGQLRAAGVGVDGLQDVCNNGAFAEIWWRPGDIVQAEDRVWRIGQKEVSWITYLLAGGTIEEHLCRIVQEKHKIIKATLDGDTDVEYGLEVWDQLIEALEHED